MTIEKIQKSINEKLPDFLYIEKIKDNEYCVTFDLKLLKNKFVLDDQVIVDPHGSYVKMVTDVVKSFDKNLVVEFNNTCRCFWIIKENKK